MRAPSPRPHDGVVGETESGIPDQDGIRQIKSKLTNHIFQQELLHAYEQKSSPGMNWCGDTKAMLDCQQADAERPVDPSRAEQMIGELSGSWSQVSGKKSYGYLPRPMKTAGG